MAGVAVLACYGNEVDAFRI